MSSPPLTGVRVVDLSTEIAGPYATKLLADAGADVVKVERPGAEDPLRRWTASSAPLAPDEDGALFRFLNASKRAALVTDPSILFDLCATADLVVESFAPGTIDAMGLAPASLRERNPRVSVVSITPFGQTGPWRDRPATAFTLEALCGGVARRGTPDRPPIHAGGRLGEWLAGGVAALGAVVAWTYARQRGSGTHVDVSMLEAMTVGFVNAHTLHKSFAGGTSSYARELEVPSIEPAHDGWVGFCTITGQQWRDFLVCIERPDLIDDTSLEKFSGRSAHVAEVNAIIHAWTSEHTVAETLERASALRVPVAPIGSGETVPHFEHFAARATHRLYPGERFLVPRPPYRLTAAPLRPTAPAPRLGEHTDAVVAELARLGAETRAGDPRAGGAVSGGTVSGGAVPEGGAAAGGPSSAEARLPFAGFRIVDFTAFWAGPFVTHFFAALGADVIKVESIQRPDGLRFASARPLTTPGAWEWSPLVHAINLGKRCITLDLSRPRGIELAKRLVALGDAVVENFSPRVMENLGLGWEALRAVNQRLIMVRMPAFGLDGPWRDHVGFAQTMEQISGMAWITGFRDGPPVIPRGPCDPLAGLHAAFALLVALEHRRRNGEGQLVEATMVEAALNAAAEQVIEYTAYGRLLERDGNRGPVGAPQGIYACRRDERGEETWLALAVRCDAEWRELASVLGDPAWTRAPALATAAGRRAAHDTIDRELAAFCASRECDALAEEVLARGIPAAPVLWSQDGEENPQHRARRFFETIAHDVVGVHAYAGLPLRFSGAPARWYHAPAPTLGEHNDEILGGLLGLSSEELAELRRDGIIGERPVGL